jgi:hypothetical protein
MIARRLLHARREAGLGRSEPCFEFRDLIGVGPVELVRGGVGGATEDRHWIETIACRKRIVRDRVRIREKVVDCRRRGRTVEESVDRPIELVECLEAESALRQIRERILRVSRGGGGTGERVEIGGKRGCRCPGGIGRRGRESRKVVPHVVGNRQWARAGRGTRWGGAPRRNATTIAVE